MKILAYPRDVNPYQELLYGPLRGRVGVEYLDISIAGPFRAATYVPRLIVRMVRKRLQGYRVLHIHWLYMLAVPAFVPGAKRIAYVQTRIFLRAAWLLGYKMVWTAHNVLPHAPITANDLAIRKLLASLSSGVIVPSSSTIAELASHGIDTGRCEVVPHGSYIGVYQNTVSQRQARQTLGIPADARVIGSFGTVHDYKNIPELVQAFVRLAARHSNLYLVLAGKCSDPGVRQAVGSVKTALAKRILMYDEYIPDSDVQRYLNAMDIAVFPFSRITTSGSILLACSFGKPVVAPRIGALQDMPDTIGVLYEPAADVPLDVLIGGLLEDPAALKRAGEASYRYAAGLSWDTIAEQTEHVYAKALHVG